MKCLNYVFPVSVLLVATSCQQPAIHFTPAKDAAIRYHGRTVFDGDSNLVLIGSASYVELIFSGDSCSVQMKNIAPEGDHNYVSIEVDNEYDGRLRIDNNALISFPVVATSNAGKHILRIYKATEASNGQVVFAGIESRGIQPVVSSTKKKIEFIGNSITCGYGADTSEVGCDAGKWYDQHNAWYAYGPRVARALNVDFMLSSVSGIGIYRNWNSNGPTMPQVYESTYLNIDSAQRWDFSRFNPDIVSICLGTNDNSDGDGKKPRLPFDSSAFVEHYIDFVNTVYGHYPQAQIALLTSPMLSGEKARGLLNCLFSIKSKVDSTHPGKEPIAIFNFQPMIPKGCDTHPDINDHEVMAKELIPFYRALLNR